MGYTIETARPDTHVRGVAVALVLSIILTWIGIAASG
jgi:hypothetical protein